MQPFEARFDNHNRTLIEGVLSGSEGLFKGLLRPWEYSLVCDSELAEAQYKARRNFWIYAEADGKCTTKEAMEFLNADQAGARHLVPWQQYLYERVFEVLPEEKRVIIHDGGTAHRMIWAPVDPWIEKVPVLLKAIVANRLCKMPAGGDPNSESELAARSVVAYSLEHSLNVDHKLGIDAGDLSNIMMALKLGMTDYLDDKPDYGRSSYELKKHHDGSIEIFTPKWDGFYVPRSVDCKVGGKRTCWEYDRGDISLHFQPEDIAGYKLRLETVSPRANSNWNIVSLVGGVVDGEGNFQDINWKWYFGPDAEGHPELELLDRRSGKYVNGRQRVAVEFFPDGMARWPYELSGNDAKGWVNYYDNLPDELPNDVNRAGVLLMRMLRPMTFMQPYLSPYDPLSRHMSESLQSGIKRLIGVITDCFERGESFAAETKLEMLTELTLMGLTNPRFLRGVMPQIAPCFKHEEILAGLSGDDSRMGGFGWLDKINYPSYDGRLSWETMDLGTDWIVAGVEAETGWKRERELSPLGQFAELMELWE